jgi:hypothetical protein
MTGWGPPDEVMDNSFVSIARGALQRTRSLFSPQNEVEGGKNVGTEALTPALSHVSGLHTPKGEEE